MAQEETKERLYALEKGLGKLERRLERLMEKVHTHSLTLKKLGRGMESRRKREEVLLAALGLGTRSKVGDRGILEELDDSILRLEDYLLAMGERVQRILSMLQEHRELLNRVGEGIQGRGQREYLRLELDVLMNSISILALAGIEVDPSIPAEVEELRRSVAGGGEIEGLAQRKDELRRRLENELSRYDLEKLFARGRIPGYG